MAGPARGYVDVDLPYWRLGMSVVDIGRIAIVSLREKQGEYEILARL